MPIWNESRNKLKDSIWLNPKCLNNTQSAAIENLQFRDYPKGVASSDAKNVTAILADDIVQTYMRI